MILDKRLIKLIQDFPNKKEDFSEDDKLIDVIDLFGSLLRERFVAQLKRYFGDYDYSDVNEKTKIKDINQIITSKNDYDISTKEEIILITSDQNNLSNNLNLSSLLTSVSIDIQFINEIPSDIFSMKNLEFRKNIFTEKEILYASLKSSPRQTMAGIWAAKECIKKLSKKFLNLNFCEIEINYDYDNKPFVIVQGEQKNKEIFISISHSNDYAVAIALLI